MQKISCKDRQQEEKLGILYTFHSVWCSILYIWCTCASNIQAAIWNCYFLAHWFALLHQLYYTNAVIFRAHVAFQIQARLPMVMSLQEDFAGESSCLHILPAAAAAAAGAATIQGLHSFLMSAVGLQHHFKPEEYCELMSWLCLVDVCVLGNMLLAGLLVCCWSACRQCLGIC